MEIGPKLRCVPCLFPWFPCLRRGLCGAGGHWAGLEGWAKNPSCVFLSLLTSSDTPEEAQQLGGLSAASLGPAQTVINHASPPPCPPSSRCLLWKLRHREARPDGEHGLFGLEPSDVSWRNGRIFCVTEGPCPQFWAPSPPWSPRGL